MKSVLLLFVAILALSCTSINLHHHLSVLANSTNTDVPLPSTTAVVPPTTTAAPLPPPTVPTDKSICELGYLKQLTFQNASANFHYIVSVSPCDAVAVYPAFNSDGTRVPSAQFCGTGFAGLTESTSPYLKDHCQHVYGTRVNTSDAFETKYANDTHTLTVKWDCTGLKDDHDPSSPVTLTFVSDDDVNRTITISTKRCIRAESDELKAGVIVAIVVVVVFAVAVIGSVLKAKCFGSGNSGSGGNNNHFAATRNAMGGNNNNKDGTNRHFHARGDADGNYQAMPN